MRRYKFSVWLTPEQAMNPTENTAAFTAFKEIAKFLAQNKVNGFDGELEYHYEADDSELNKALIRDDVNWKHAYVVNADGDAITVNYQLLDDNAPLNIVPLYNVNSVCTYGTFVKDVSAADAKTCAKWVDLLVKTKQDHKCLDLLIRLIEAHQRFCLNVLQASPVNGRYYIVDAIAVQTRRMPADGISAEDFAHAVCDYILDGENKSYPDERLVIIAYLYNNPAGGKNNYGKCKLRELDEKRMCTTEAKAFFGDNIAKQIAALASEHDLVIKVEKDNAEFKVSGEIIGHKYYRTDKFTFPAINESERGVKTLYDMFDNRKVKCTTIANILNITSIDLFVKGLKDILKGQNK